MQIFKQDWWATPVWYFDIPQSTVNYLEIEKECYQHKLIDSGNQISNVGGYQSNNIFVNNAPSEIKKLLLTVEDMSTEWYREFGVRSQFPKKIDNCWININSINNYNKPHVHQQSIFSGVYYVKAGNNAGCITFNNQSDRDFILQTFTDQNRYTVSDLNYDAVAGRVIIFPSWIQHSVSINQSNEDRISIAFNMT